MGIARHGFGAGFGALSRQVVVGTLLGLIGVTALLAGVHSNAGTTMSMVAIAAIPIVVAAFLKPRFGMMLFLFAMAFIEEFRGGIGDTGAGGNESLRSERTAFYAKTLGIPAVYLPDMLVAGLLGLFVFRVILTHRPIDLRLDKIGIGLLLLAFSILFSIAIPLMGPDPFGPAVLDLSTLGSIKLPAKNVANVERYLPILQYKLFFLLFPSYALGLLFFRQERDIAVTIRIVGIAMVATVALGVWRVAQDPGMIRKLVPVIFDTGSVALMAMTIFYLVARWASNHYSAIQASLYGVLSSALMVLVLLSFRRTMWGAIAISLPLFPFLIPRHARPRLFVIVGIGLAIGLLLLAATPPGQALMQSVVSRAGQTHLNQSSTLYRYAIMTWVVNNFFDLPWFGYGLMPMWNEKVYIRFFVISMENVHSLYIWLLIRLGLLGFIISMTAFGLFIVRIREVAKVVRDEHYQIILGVILLSIVMYLFNGVFNPVYANVRHLVPLGLSLALVTRLPAILADRAAAIRESK